MYSDHELSIGASLGYAQLPEDGDNKDSHTPVADMRMYQSKHERKLIPIKAV
jgi:predicted signal transduction protein with EAL and GGDEF domain